MAEPAIAGGCQIKLPEAGGMLDLIQGRFKDELKAEASSGIF